MLKIILLGKLSHFSKIAGSKTTTFLNMSLVYFYVQVFF